MPLMSYWNVALCRECMCERTAKEECTGEGGSRDKKTLKNACSPVCRGGQQYTKNKKQGVSIMSDVVLFSLLPPNGKKKKKGISTVLGGASRNLQHKQQQSMHSHSF